MNNYSKQRELILEVIKNNRIHPTAQEIYELVIQQQPRISRSTVYRNIQILVQQENIQKITMGTGPDRYDYIKEMHHHAICYICGKIFDFKYSFAIDEITKQIKQQTQTQFDVARITVHGICEICKLKKKEE